MGRGPLSDLERKAMFAKLNSGDLDGLRSSDLVGSDEINSLPQKEKTINLGLIKNHLRKINDIAKHNKKIEEAKKAANAEQKAVDRQKIEDNKEMIKQLQQEVHEIASGKAHHDPHMEALMESKSHKTLPRPMTPKEVLAMKNEGKNDTNKTSKEKEEENKVIVNITNEPVERKDALGNRTTGSKKSSKKSGGSSSGPSAGKPTENNAISNQKTQGALEPSTGESAPSPVSEKKGMAQSTANLDDALTASLAGLT